MTFARPFALTVSSAVLAAGLVLHPAAADDTGKEVTCPVMGSTFKVTKSTKSVNVNGQPVYLCCAGCVSAFAKDPDKYVEKVSLAACPVMPGVAVKASKDLRAVVNQEYYYFCCAACPTMFANEPAKFITHELTDPVSGKKFKVSANQPTLEREGARYFFESSETKSQFEKAPQKYTRK